MHKFDETWLNKYEHGISQARSEANMFNGKLIMESDYLFPLSFQVMIGRPPILQVVNHPMTPSIWGRTRSSEQQPSHVWMSTGLRRYTWNQQPSLEHQILWYIMHVSPLHPIFWERPCYPDVWLLNPHSGRFEIPMLGCWSTFCLRPPCGQICTWTTILLSRRFSVFWWCLKTCVFVCLCLCVYTYTLQGIDNIR